MNPSTEQMQKISHDALKACEDSMNATMKSFGAISKGCEETARCTSGLMQEGLNRAMTGLKTIMDAKNLQDMMSLHSEYMKDIFDCCMEGTGRISEISARTMKDAIAPVAQHTNNTMSKMMQKASTAT